MTEQEKARYLIAHPEALGRALGYKDLRPMHGTWIKQMVFGQDDMTLQAHRGSYKTTCLCIAIAMMMIYYRNKNIIFFRKTDTDVMEVIKNVNRILNEPVFQQLCVALTNYPLEVIRATSTEITTNYYSAPRGASQIQGMGITGSITGKHGDIIMTDDIINLKDRISNAEREHTKAVYMELQNIRNRGGRIINSGTPWHKNDAFVLMPPPQVWDYKQTGLISDEKATELRRQMSPSLFAANYELRHIAAEDALFTKAPEFFTEKNYLRNGVAHVDAAYGGEDSTAFTCGRKVGNKFYMYGRIWHAHIDTVLDQIIAECDRLMCWPILVEENADKGFLRKEIRKKGKYSKGYSETENKYIKISTHLRKWWENMVWLEGTDDNYLAEILDYTDHAEHDDAPDSASCIARYLDRF